MIDSPGMMRAFPAEGGGVGGTSVKDSRLVAVRERARGNPNRFYAMASERSAFVGPNSSSNACRSATSRSAIVTSWPRSSSEVTP